MECKNETCSINVVSTGNRVKEFCSARCRMQHKRSKANIQSEQIQSEQEQPAQSEQDIITEVTVPSVTPPRVAPTQAFCVSDGRPSIPDTLNYGHYVTAPQLKQAGFKSNRVSIPGDHDYKGVCKQQGSVWQVAA